MSSEWDDDRSNRHRHSVDVHDEWDELAVGYALTALEPEELQRFVEHLVLHCPQCRDSVNDMSVIGADIAVAMDGPVPQPRESLRDSVMSAALLARPAVPQETGELITFPSRSVPFSVAETRPSETVPSENVPSEASPGEAGVRGDELSVRRNRRLAARSGWLVAAAAAIVALVLSVTTVNAVHGRNEQTALNDRANRALRVLADGGSATMVPLTDNAGRNSATVVARRNNVSVVTQSMKANSANTSYVLWGLAKVNGTPVALGDFDVSGKVDTIQVASDARGGYASLQAFGISLERGHTPPAKPSSILALGQR